MRLSLSLYTSPGLANLLGLVNCIVFFSNIEEGFEFKEGVGEKTEGEKTLGAEADGEAGMALLGFMNSYCAQLVVAIKQKITTTLYFFIPNKNQFEVLAAKINDILPTAMLLYLFYHLKEIQN